MKNGITKLSTAERSEVEAAFSAGGPIILKVTSARAATRTVQSLERYAEGTAVTVHSHRKVVVAGRRRGDGYPFETLVTWLPVRERRARAVAAGL